MLGGILIIGIFVSESIRIRRDNENKKKSSITIGNMIFKKQSLHQSMETDMINPIHFQELSEKDPSDVCRRALCRYDQADRKYTLSVWNEEVCIFPHHLKIESKNKTNDRSDYFHLFAIHYLLKAKITEMANSWISEKDVSGGATFFRGPHRIPTDIVTNRFNNDIGEFKKRCEQLGGKPIRMADAAYTLKITQRIPVAVLYWRGDDDFPAEFKILYDRTVTEHLALDIIYALAVGICRRLGAR